MWQKKTHLAKILELKTSQKYKEGIENFWKSVHFREKIRKDRNIVSCSFQDHSLGVVTSIWGPQKESACMDGSNTEVNCDGEKQFCEKCPEC